VSGWAGSSSIEWGFDNVTTSIDQSHLMGYRFQGYFSDGGETVKDAALRLWPFCTVKAIVSPFRGFGLRAPDPDSEAGSDEEYERLLELPFAVERGLEEFSRGFPCATFVFIDADCFGGTCVYTGFAVRDGVVGLRVDDGAERLQRLLQPLGVQLESGSFAPFVRGYW
jgi:hypothetical protein